MDELKNHKKKLEVAKENQEDRDLEGNKIKEEILEKEEGKTKHHAKHKATDSEKPKPKKDNPNLGKKIQYAAYAAVSSTERLINGLGSIYENIFVGRNERKHDFNKEQGLKCFEKGDYADALSYFKSYIEDGNESDAEVLFLLAMSHVNLEEYKEAVEYFEKARKLDDTDLDITVEFAHCLFNLEEYTEAAACFKQAIEMAPDEADYYYLLGACSEKTGQIEEAKEMYKKAIDLSPREATYYHALGFVYENSGNHKDAIACFKKAMDLDRTHSKGGGCNDKKSTIKS